MSGNALVTQDRTWILDRCANIKVPTFWVVRRDEIETVRILVVDARGIHEPTGGGWLERVGKLTNSELADIRRNRDQSIRLQEIDDLFQARPIGCQELGFVLRYMLCARRIGRRERRVLQHR